MGRHLFRRRQLRPRSTTACGDPDETVTFATAPPTIVTQALTPVTIGSPINDTAIVTGVTGLPAPTGTVTFTLYGPNDAACGGAIIFTSANAAPRLADARAAAHRHRHVRQLHAHRPRHLQLGRRLQR